MTMPTCPICDSISTSKSFPWHFSYGEHRFSHCRCLDCGTVFLFPLPRRELLCGLYTKVGYTDEHYAEADVESYRRLLMELLPFLPGQARVLDYGCGAGLFLKASREAGLDAIGVEMSSCVAESASRLSGCEVFLDSIFKTNNSKYFDLIHLGDVLEHLSEPHKDFRVILGFLKSGGVLSIDGPLEENPSPVLWVARLFGFIKLITRFTIKRTGVPAHIVRFSESSFRVFINQYADELTIIKWKVYETGWPYSNGGSVKRWVARLARGFGGTRVGDITLGNRVFTILKRNTNS